MDHRATMAAGGRRRRRRRTRLQGAPPQWADVSDLLHKRLNDAAAELNVPVTYLRRLCRQNGFPQWPGKKIRYLKRTGKNVILQVDAQDGASPGAGLAGPSQLAKKNTETQKEEDDDEETTRIHAPVANHPPREELTTLNLIDKLGSSSSSESS